MVKYSLRVHKMTQYSMVTSRNVQSASAASTPGLVVTLPQWDNVANLDGRLVNGIADHSGLEFLDLYACESYGTCGITRYPYIESL